MSRLRLGQLLVDAHLITQQALDEVLTAQRADGRRLGTLLVERKLINETQLTQILSHQLAVPWVSLLHIEFSRQLLNLVPKEVAERYCLVPIYVRNVRGQGETLYVAMDDPSNDEALRECAQFSGLPVRAMIAPPSDIESAIRVYYRGSPTRGTQPRAAAPAPAPPDAPPAPAPPAPSASQGRDAAGGFAPSSAAPAGASTAHDASPASLDDAAVPELHALSALQASDSFEPAPKPSSRPLMDRGDEPSQQRARPSAVRVRSLLSALGAAPAPEADAEIEVREIPPPRGRAPRMVALTLLDGTTINLPRSGKKVNTESTSSDANGASDVDEPDSSPGLTAKDLVSALRAVAHGQDASEIFSEAPRWETLFAALLSLLLKKGLIADWEFVDELKKT